MPAQVLYPGDTHIPHDRLSDLTRGAVVNVLEGIERTYGAFRNTNTVPSIVDPGYPSVNVAKRWTSTEFDEFMTQVQSAAVIARQALDQTAEATSRVLWRRLFGNGFGQ